ncbi:MAG: hypothetical protein PHT69_11780 [Bacteroidales bacterium]|nr:hypothetical protein [Bacteroidales bacterium]
MNPASLKTSNFSQHLFWDINTEELDYEKNKNIIIQRVLQYGFLSDWLIIYKHYGLKVITEVTISLRDLDNKSIYFIASLSNIPVELFLCYTTKQSMPKHWDL